MSTINKYLATKKLRLAFIGDANWDIYADENDSLYSIPKQDACPSCQASCFGDKEHIRRLMSSGYFSDQPTEAGLELLEGLHSKCFTSLSGKKFYLLKFKRDPNTLDYENGRF